jgi:pimeloyl-ACP methyl ester carboxylesterase
MQTFRHRGLQIAYEDTGHPTRPPLVLIHGWLSKRADLAAVAQAFRTSHRVVSIDLPGHGESQVPEDESRLSIPSFAHDVAALCDELGLSGAALVGHSLGAAVAVDLAVRRPELAAAVVALDGVVLMPSALLEGSRRYLPRCARRLGGRRLAAFSPRPSCQPTTPTYCAACSQTSIRCRSTSPRRLPSR